MTMMMTTNTAAISFLLLQGAFAHDKNVLRGSSSSRVLQASTTANKDAWPECISGLLTPEECSDLISEEVVDHTLEDIKVKIASPRSDVQLAESFHLVGVFTNYLGDVIGRYRNGFVDYSFMWEGTGPEGTRSVGPWDCSGMDALSCCYDVILADVSDSNVNGDYMQCFISEKGVEVDPHPNGSETEVAFYTYVYNTTSEEHERIEITMDDMHNEELVTKDELDASRAIMEELVLDPSGTATVDEIETLTKNLQFYARAYELGPAMNLITEMAALVKTAQDNSSETTMDVSAGSDLAMLFEGIEFHITKYEAQGVHPGAYVVIRTNSDGDISHVPELELDYRLPEDSTTEVPVDNGGDDAGAIDTPGTGFDQPPPPILPPLEEPSTGGDIPAPPCDPEDPFCSGPGGPGGNQYYENGDFGTDGPQEVPKFCRKKGGDINVPGTCLGTPCQSDWDCPSTKTWTCNLDCSPVAGSNTETSKTEVGKGGGEGPGGPSPGGLGPPGGLAPP